MAEKIRDIEKLAALIFTNDKVLIIGYPQSGKTTLYNNLAEYEESLNYYGFRTDIYINRADFEGQLYLIIEDLSGKDKWIAEGIQGYRLLRKIEELDRDDLRPDLIIVCRTRRPMLPKHARMRKMVRTVWDKYEQIRKKEIRMVEYWN